MRHSKLPQDFGTCQAVSSIEYPKLLTISSLTRLEERLDLLPGRAGVLRAEVIWARGRVNQASQAILEFQGQKCEHVSHCPISCLIILSINLCLPTCFGAQGV